MAKPLIEDFLALESDGIVVYDAHLECDALLVAPVICILADNPRHCEIVNHLGTSAKMYCRICMVSVTSVFPFFPVSQNCISGCM